ncbi:glycoside hydrolase [Rhizodiscina lignyota]|uniref:Alpha-galactosidase n=1 Tax=Rhizodiscina lignyota TaxID=1504668 RepID=A0A9P4ISB8_9PEZI|nr:glycoside hydrolase [Rhizodiscina lignyota]
MTLLLSLLVPLVGLSRPSTALDTGSDIGRLPALGWNSWNAYHYDISQSKIITAAEKLVSLGLKDAGYEYVNIDDAWSVKDGRDPKTQRLVPDPDKFPDGINGTADKIHSMGLKLGIYSSAGTKTCAGYPASIGYETIDAQTWADWGVDYLKYDNCNVPKNWSDTCDFCVPNNDNGSGNYPNGTCTDDRDFCPSDYDFSKSNTAKRYAIMRDAIEAAGRPMLYSLCEWGNMNVQTWGNETAHSWRATGDIGPTWTRVKDILNMNSFFMNYVDFYGHSDADMLEVGNGQLSYAQCRTHFALWAAMKSPLLIGTPLDTISSDMLGILKNKYLLEFNQDPVVGGPATPYKWGTNPDWTWNSSYPAEFWAGSSSNGILVLMMNTYDETKTKIADWGEVPGLEAGASYEVVDAWTGKSLGCQEDGVNATVLAYDTAVLLVQDKCGGDEKSRLLLV